MQHKFKKMFVFQAKFQCSQPLTILLFIDGYHYDFNKEADTSMDPYIFFRRVGVRVDRPIS